MIIFRPSVSNRVVGQLKFSASILPFVSRKWPVCFRRPWRGQGGGEFPQCRFITGAGMISFDNRFNRIFITCILPIVFLAATVHRNNLWQSDLTLSRDLVQHAPTKCRPHVSLGLAYFAETAYDRAVEEYYAAISADPSCVPAYHNLGLVLTAKQLPNKAIDAYEAALRIVASSSHASAEPDSEHLAALHDNLGNLYVERGRMIDAVDQFSRAIAADPSKAQYFIDRGLAQLRMRAYDPAVRDFTTAIDRMPESATAYMNRGNAWDEKGNAARALADYDQAIRLDPQYANAYYNRGVCREREGERAVAADDLRKACELGNASACAALRSIHHEAE
jgi:tetratricopeptide (TPR) repeat protein